MLILYLNASGALGGAERSLLDILASLRQAQPAWDLHLAVAADGPLSARARDQGVLTRTLPFPPALARLGETGAGSPGLAVQLGLASVPAFGYARRLRALVADVGPDIVHSNSLKMHILAPWVCGGVPFVWHFHDYVGARKVTARLLRRSARRPATAIANSESVAEDAKRVLGIPVHPVLNAIDLARFSVAGEHVDLDGLAGLPPAPPPTVRVGLVGTYGRWKGHLTFLDALARLPTALPVRGYIIGGPLYDTAASQYSRAELTGHAERLGLGDRIGFTGFIAEPERALRALDIVVHASTEPEPFGLVIVEAMACGRPVIASDAGGAREIFTPGVDAVPHDPGDARGLAARILHLVTDPEARRRLGHAGRQTAERRFDRARLAVDLLPVYERALASR